MMILAGFVFLLVGLPILLSISVLGGLLAVGMLAIPLAVIWPLAKFFSNSHRNRNFRRPGGMGLPMSGMLQIRRQQNWLQLRNNLRPTRTFG